MENQVPAPKRNRRRSPRWALDESLLRSALQKYCRRGLADKAVVIASEMILNGIGLSIARTLLLIAFEDFGPAAPHLVTSLIKEVDEWITAFAKLRCKVAELCNHPQMAGRLLSLVAWVADPKWERCRAWPMINNRSLKAIECGESPEDNLIGDVIRSDLVWMAVGAPHGSPWYSPSAPPPLVSQSRILLSLCTKNAHLYERAMVLIQSRLVMTHAFADERGLIPKPLYLPPSPRVMDAVSLLAADVPCPVLEYFVKDKHTAPGWHTDMTFFFDHAAQVVNEKPLSCPQLKAWVAEGREWYMELERRHGTKESRSTSIRARLHSASGPRTPPPAAAHTRKRPLPPAQKTSSSKRTKVSKKSSKASAGVFQAAVRARAEENMPLFLRGREWAQKVCSKIRPPVIIVSERKLVYKGPFDPSNKLHASRIENIRERHDALVACGVATPKGTMEHHGDSVFWVTEYIDDLENPFHKDKTADDIPDDAALIAGVVVMGVGKHCLRTLGDLCCRNAGWSPSRCRYYAFDLEDNNNCKPDLVACDPFELVFSPLGRATKAKRQRLVALMKKHKAAVMEALDAVTPNAHPGFDAELFAVCRKRVDNL